CWLPVWRAAMASTSSTPSTTTGCPARRFCKPSCNPYSSAPCRTADSAGCSGTWRTRMPGQVAADEPGDRPVRLPDAEHHAVAEGVDQRATTGDSYDASVEQCVFRERVMELVDEPGPARRCVTEQPHARQS